MDWKTELVWFISGVTTGLVTAVFFASDESVRKWILVIQMILVLIEIIILARRMRGV